MSFFKNVVSGFKEAVKAGSDFNPLLEDVVKQIETLHEQGRLEDTLYKAEQEFEKEHNDYLAKGIHTNAADSQRDSAALKHFMATLEKSEANLDPSLKENAEHLIELRDKMQNILSNAMSKK